MADPKATDLAEAIKIPEPGTQAVPARTGDGLVADPAVHPPTGPAISVNPEAPEAPPPLLALPGTNRGPKVEAVAVNPSRKVPRGTTALDRSETYEVTEAITVTVRGERIVFAKGDEINFHHHKPGTMKDFQRQGMKLESKA